MFFYQRHTLVSALSPEEVQTKMRAVINPKQKAFPELMTTEYRFLNEDDEKYVFNGKIDPKGFRIFREMRHVEHFSPLIIGKIEKTAQGSILFIRYQMFKGTLWILLTGLSILLLLAFLFLFVQHNWLHSLFFLVLSLGVYIIILLNFKQKVKICVDLLENVLR